MHPQFSSVLLRMGARISEPQLAQDDKEGEWIRLHRLAQQSKWQTLRERWAFWTIAVSTTIMFRGRHYFNFQPFVQ